MVEHTNMPKHIPLLFTYRDRVGGSGFMADVTSKGRVLGVEEEEGEVWIYGVQPGGLAASGPDPKAALEAFRETFTKILRDLADEARTFEEFRAAVQGFFNAINEPTECEWRQAVDDVRSGKLNIPGVRSENADGERFVLVEQQQQSADHRQQFAVMVQIDSAIAA